MKKTIIILAFVLGFTTYLSAQYKPTKGFDAEVNFRPFNANPIQIDYLKARMFLNDKMAVRLGFEFNSYAETAKTVFNQGTATELIQETKNSYFIFGLHPGIEIHMAGSERLSPYFGAELNISFKSAKTDITNQGGTANKSVTCEGMWSTATNPAYTMIGLNLIFGVDYYVAKHIYLGTEMGFGFQSFANKDVVLTTTTGGASTSVTTPGGSSSNLGVNFNSAIRLGWSF